MDVHQNKAGLGRVPVKSCCLARLMWKTSSADQVLLQQKKRLEAGSSKQHKTAGPLRGRLDTLSRDCFCLTFSLSSCLEITTYKAAHKQHSV